MYFGCYVFAMHEIVFGKRNHNYSESGSGHISHRNLNWLIIVFVVLCSHIYSQLHCFSLVRPTVIGGELSGDISHRNMCLLLILIWNGIQKCDTFYNLILLETNLHEKLLFNTHKSKILFLPSYYKHTYFIQTITIPHNYYF